MKTLQRRHEDIGLSGLDLLYGANVQANQFREALLRQSLEVSFPADIPAQRL
jgi:hypothetical protein